MTHEKFKDIKSSFTENLAIAFEKALRDMGDDAKGISWFSSVAESHPKNTNK